jgi:hypothetical protein
LHIALAETLSYCDFEKRDRLGGNLSLKIYSRQRNFEYDDFLGVISYAAHINGSWLYFASAALWALAHILPARYQA